jgi:hypothetical protein
VRLVLGQGVGDDWGPAEAAGTRSSPAVCRAAAGSYCTGVWLSLARGWDDWRRSHSAVVLCDTDPVSGLSHLALLRSSAA